MWKILRQLLLISVILAFVYLPLLTEGKKKKPKKVKH